MGQTCGNISGGTGNDSGGGQSEFGGNSETCRTYNDKGGNGAVRTKDYGSRMADDGIYLHGRGFRHGNEDNIDRNGALHTHIYHDSGYPGKKENKQFLQAAAGAEKHEEHIQVL